jgi:FkbM family methyltransferase
MMFSRKQFLHNTMWGTAGAAVGVFVRGLVSPDPASMNLYTPPARNVVIPQTTAPEPTAPPPDESSGERSFSQCGEDLIVRFIFQYRGIGAITYLDVGANDPIVLNNTYYFYRKGYKGVLVEPNVALCEELRRVRPKDTTLAAGIGVTAVREADYYVMNEPALNTFSKEQAEQLVKATNGSISIREVIKIPLLNINDVMQEHFKGAPTFLSIDTEGLDLAILKSIDYTRYRPKVICAETLVATTSHTIPEIPQFLEAQGYVARGGSLVNTVFIDSKIL